MSATVVSTATCCSSPTLFYFASPHAAQRQGTSNTQLMCSVPLLQVTEFFQLQAKELRGREDWQEWFGEARSLA
jgi:hypothetical protein